jgi:uncharacterized phage infection (PIP) family protein YhgE
LVLLLSACSNNSSPSVPSPPSSVPVVTPNPSNAAFGTLCSDLGQLEQVVSGMITGSVTPSAGIEQVQSIAQRLRDTAQQIQQTQPTVAATIDDLATAVDQLRTALSSGGDVLSTIGSSVTTINADIQQLPTSVCGTTPSPIQT